MTKISLVRHGLVHNPDEVYYGRLPGFGLAELGREQATAAGHALALESIAAVYHSPMQRAAETAAIVRAHCAVDAPLVETPLLNEIHSPFDGRPVAEMEQRGWDFYRDENMSYERPEQILTRVLRFFDQAREEHPGRHVVGVSHGDPIAFAIVWANNLPLTAEHRKRLTECGLPDNYPSPASISTFTFAEGDERRLVGFRYQWPFDKKQGLS